MPSKCIVCKKTARKDEGVSLYRFPPKSEPVKRQVWLNALRRIVFKITTMFVVTISLIVTSHKYLHWALGRDLCLLKSYIPQEERALQSAKRKCLSPFPMSTPKHCPCSSRDITAVWGGALQSIWENTTLYSHWRSTVVWLQCSSVTRQWGVLWCWHFSILWWSQ